MEGTQPSPNVVRAFLRPQSALPSGLFSQVSELKMLPQKYVNSSIGELSISSLNPTLKALKCFSISRFRSIGHRKWGFFNPNVFRKLYKILQQIFSYQNNFYNILIAVALYFQWEPLF